MDHSKSWEARYPQSRKCQYVSDVLCSGCKTCLILFDPTVLRSLAEGRIGWAFWPPGTSLENIATTGDNLGIWIPLSDVTEDVSDRESEDEDVDETQNRTPTTATEDEDDSEDSEFSEKESIGISQVGISGRFGALALGEEEEEDETSE